MTYSEITQQACVHNNDRYKHAAISAAIFCQRPTKVSREIFGVFTGRYLVVSMANKADDKWPVIIDRYHRPTEIDGVLWYNQRTYRRRSLYILWYNVDF